MVDFRRITLLCLGHRFSKHKMTICSKNLGGWAPRLPLARPMYQGRRETTNLVCQDHALSVG